MKRKMEESNIFQKIKRSKSFTLIAVQRGLVIRAHKICILALELISSILWFQVLTLLEGAIKREFLFSDFETTSELLESLNPGRYAVTSSHSLETVAVLPWVPRTSAAVALRVMELDAAIFYVPQQKVESQKDKGSDVIVSKIFCGV